MNRPRILLTGATGLLGSRLAPVLGGLGGVIPLGHSVEPAGGYRIDLSDADETRALLDRLQPSAIVHAAALTDIDECEREPTKAYRLNVAATRHLVDWAVSRGRDVSFVYVSTDQVYDRPGGSSEEQVAPINVYGLTKLWAEDLARRLAQCLILRTNFFGQGTARRASFVDWIVASCRQRRPVTLFTDVHFNPLHVDHLCLLVGELIERRADGTYNLGATGGGLSKAEFARAVASALKLPVDCCRDGRLADVSLAARRPHDMRMNVERVERVLGHPLPTLAAGIEKLAQDWRAGTTDDELYGSLAAEAGAGSDCGGHG